MNPIGILDLITLLITFFTIIYFLIYWKNQFSFIVKLAFISFLLIISFYYLSNFLEWSEISDIFVVLEDYIALLAPLFFIFMLYMYIQKKSKEEISRKEKKFRILFDSAGDAIFFHDFNGKILEVNRTACFLLGHSKEELLKMNLNEFENFRHPFLEASGLKELLQKESTFYRTEYISKEGSSIPIELSSKIINYEGKKAILSIARDVSARKKTKSKLKREREKSQLYLDLVGVMIVALNTKGEITLVNKKGCEILEYDEEELIGKNYFETCMPSDIKDKFFSGFKKLLLGERELTEFYINPIITKDGKKKIIAWHNAIIYDIRDNIIGTISSGNDITEQKEFEKKLRESEEKFRNIAEQTHIGIAIIQDDVIKYVNQRMADLFGYSVEEALVWKPREFLKLFAPDSLEMVIDQVKRKQSGDPRQFPQYPVHCVKKSGELFWVDNISKTITYQGLPADFVTVIDITERMRAEQELIESEQRFRSITEQSAVGIGIIQNEILVYLNDKLEELLSYPKEELLTLEPGIIYDIIHPDDREKIIIMSQGHQSNSPLSERESQLRIIQKDKNIITLEVHAKQILYRGEPAALGMFVDITEREKAENIIKNELNRLKEIDQIKDDLIRRISHELNTPLVSIYSTVNLILNNFSNQFGDEMLDLIKIIDKGGQRLKILFDNLLDVYNLESNQLEIHKKTTNLIDIINNAIKNIDESLVEREHKLNVILPDKIMIDIDSKRINQVLTNLLSNALKYTPPKGIIFVKANENQDQVEIIIQDSGIGFTEEEKQKLFTKFGKIERYGKGLDVDIEGPGLGLYISNEIIQLHGGELFFNSEGRDKGSIFIIKLKK
ncbi:MAG: PAS domain S-box protein [Promethearchaeota archaeon]